MSEPAAGVSDNATDEQGFANLVEEIVQKMLLTTTSERQGRVIDGDTSSMEDKKKDGYF